MLDAALAADLVEAHDAVAGGPAVAVARRIGERDAIVGEDGVQPIGHGFDQRFEE